MRILIVNGPNMNMLGIREPALYGAQTYDDLCRDIQAFCDGEGISASFYQSNHEGDLIQALQDAYGRFDGLVINAAAYTHTSIALLDTLKAVAIPAVEVHLTDIAQREPFRRVSYVGMACIHHIAGKGFSGYLEAIAFLKAYLQKKAR